MPASASAPLRAGWRRDGRQRRTDRGRNPEPGARRRGNGIVGQPDDGTGNGANAAVDNARIIRTGIHGSRGQRCRRRGHEGPLGDPGDGRLRRWRATPGRTGSTPYAEIAYRIPADRWEDALAELRVLGGLTTKVVSEQTQAAEVTAQIVDLEARIRNLQASETAFQGIAARATKISDVLEIQAQLTNVRGQIEQLTAQLKDLNDRAAFATLTARFTVPVVAVQVAQSEWEPGTAVDEASATLISTLQGLTDAGIWLVIVWVPILLMFGIVALIGFFIARRMGVGRRDILPPAPPAPPAELPTAG